MVDPLIIRLRREEVNIGSRCLKIRGIAKKREEAKEEEIYRLDNDQFINLLSGQSRTKSYLTPSG